MIIFKILILMKGIKTTSYKVIEIDEKSKKYIYLLLDRLYVASYIGNKGFKLDRISWRDTNIPVQIVAWFELHLMKKRLAKNLILTLLILKGILPST